MRRTYRPQGNQSVRTGNYSALLFSLIFFFAKSQFCVKTSKQIPKRRST